MKFVILGVIVALAIAVPLFAPSVWERIHRNPAPITTVPGKSPQPAPKPVSAPAGSHRAGAR